MTKNMNTFWELKWHIKNMWYFSQKKVCSGSSKGTRLLRCKPANTPTEANVDLWFDNSHILDNPGRYRRLIRKLIYLTVTRPNITLVVGVLSRFMHQRRKVHWTTALRILTYIKSSPRKGLYIRSMNMYTFLSTLILVMLVLKVIGNLLLDIAPLLEKILWHGGVRNKMCFNLMQSLNIELWLILLVRWYSWRI